MDVSKMQIEKAYELKDALEKAGFMVSEPIHSKTNFGRSTYLYLLDEDGIPNEGKKFRISDHDTGVKRFWSEYHFYDDSDVNDIVNRLKRDIEKAERKISNKKYWESIKSKFENKIFVKWDSIKEMEDFKNEKYMYQGVLYDSAPKYDIYQRVSNFVDKKGRKLYTYEYTQDKKLDGKYTKEQLEPSNEWIEWYRANNENKFKQGGKLKTYWYKGLFN
jgi:hypothetical protein